jgi:iron complex outermembrane receptor protein
VGEIKFRRCSVSGALQPLFAADFSRLLRLGRRTGVDNHMLKKAGLLAAIAACAASPAAAQRASDNVLTAAEDAFGASIGTETIGLYSASQVRGFSPVTAGNVRISGVYLDRQGAINNTLISGSTVRVGLTAQGYPFPAPTGIVDYQLRTVGDKPLFSAVAAMNPYGGYLFEVDGQLPINDKLGVAGGASFARRTYADGTAAPAVDVAIIPHWRPVEGVEIIPFWSLERTNDNEIGGNIITAGPYAPPHIQRNIYFGQPWAQIKTYDMNTGVIGKAVIADNWRITAGIFRSVSHNWGNFSELFVNSQPNGLSTERVTADPGQKYASNSGEFRLSRAFVEGPRLHTLHASVRVRRLDSLYGGAATPVEYPNRMLDEIVAMPRPNFVFGERTQDHVRQTTFGLAYEGRWRDVGELSLGVQHADYRKTIDIPGAPAPTVAHDQPWLPNAAAALYLRKDLALYGSYTRGLEESGLAPNTAANRNAALPAIRTQQMDGGLRWIINPKMKLVAGLFDVRKPYFNTDENNRYVVLGDVRNRGAEISLAGSPVQNLSVVAGAVLMQARVTGDGVRLGRVGPKPLNQPEQVLRGNAEYRLPAIPGFSVDVAVSHYGSRVATRDNVLTLDPYTLVDLGARYRFKTPGGYPAQLRAQVLNVTNAYVWRIGGSNTFSEMDKRRFAATLAVDF